MTSRKVLKLIGGSVCSLGILSISTIASAASIDPPSYEADIRLGETISINKTVTLDAIPVRKVDILFLADNTGSMGSIINAVKNSATSLLNDLSTTFDDIEFGVSRYLGDPLEGDPPNSAYTLLNSVDAGTNADAVSAINSWFASGGGDLPEANFYALQQSATSGATTDGIGSTDLGYSSGFDTGWRDGAKRFAIWFGDAPSHTTTVDQNEAIDALVNNGVTVLAINTQSAGSGIDTSGQATAIVNATGGSLTNNVNASGVVSTIRSIVGDATSSLDLEFFSRGDTSGLDVLFTCTDAKGCDDVEGGESRNFRVDITGKAVGTYNFEVGITGVDAIETDKITVSGIPEPLTILGATTAASFGAFFKKKISRKAKNTENKA